MRLRTKFAIVFVAVTLVVSGSVFVTLESYKRDAVDESQSNVNETAVLVAEQIDASIDERRDHVGLVASRPSAREFDRSRQFLDAFLANSRFFAAQIVDANGTVVGFRGAITAEQRQTVLGSDRSNESYVRAALRGNSYVGDLQYVEQTDEHVLVFSAPIFENRTISGVFVAALYLDTQTVFEVLPPLETSSQSVEIVGEGRELHASNRTFETSVASSATVESTGWRVTVARDRTPLDARLGRLALFQAVELGVVLLVMVGFGAWQYSVSLRQTERLLTGFIELGGGNYEYSVSLHGGREWEQMSNGFGDLANTLQAREAALRDREQRLEVLYRVLRHNLRNQLSVILTYADLITDVSDDDQVVRSAQRILASSRNLTDLSETARQIETALEGDLERTPIEVTTVVSGVVADLRSEYPAVEVQTSLPDSAWVLALPSLRFAIESLCENACEHNDSDDPWVEVSVTTGPRTGTEEAGVDVEPAAKTDEKSTHGSIDMNRGGTRDTVADESVHIAVVDNGPGIPEGDRTAIRAGRETALEHTSGLGLWLAYWIVENSEGELGIRENEPRGSIVDLFLDSERPPKDDTGFESRGSEFGTA